MMYQRYPVKLGRLVDKAAEQTLARCREGTRTEEPEITSTFMTLVESELNGRNLGGVRVTTIIYKSRSRGQGEKLVGADFANLLDIRFQDFRVQKAFLGQAKRIPGGRDPDRQLLSDRNLEAQCRKMLDITPASFVFVYTQDEVTVVPAVDVYSLLNCTRPRPTVMLHRKKVGSFYAEFFKTFIGDHRIVQAVGDARALAEFAERYAIPRVQYISLTRGTRWA
jgi:hypothetical protein